MIGSPYQANYRWQAVKRFPYLIYFEPITARTIHIYAIAHARQRPGFWLRRVNRP